jgi:hypothetical protein
MIYLKSALQLIIDVVNLIHDTLMNITGALGFTFTDKDLHFWVIGIIGIIMFILTQVFFKILSKWSITAISFIYTFTVLIVIVFAIEIQQKVTGSGNMEFADVVAGINGFIVIFLLYLLLKIGYKVILKGFKK